MCTHISIAIELPKASTRQVLYNYDGEWRADKRHGQGSCLSCLKRGKEKYSGHWAEDVYHGSGTQIDADGALYEGEWLQGKFHGVGKHAAGSVTYTGLTNTAFETSYVFLRFSTQICYLGWIRTDSTLPITILVWFRHVCFVCFSLMFWTRCV